MKKLTMIVHSSLQQNLADCLRSLPQIDTFIFSHVEEHSSQLEHDPFLSARDKVVGYVPQVRVDVLLQDDAVASVLESIRHSKCKFKGKGIYWISNLPEAGEL
jgi:nitrogen regulatory protein P-II 1